MGWVGFLIASVFAGFVALAWRFHSVEIRATRAIVAPSDRVLAEVEIYKASAQLVGGAAIVAGLLMSWFQLEVSREQFTRTLDSQRQQIELGRGQLDLLKRTQAVERLNTSISHVGSLDPMIRTGGILMLEQIALEYPSHYGPIAKNIVIALLKRRATENAFNASKQTGDPWPSADLRTALLVIGRLLPPKERLALDLRYLYLKNANLRGIQLSSLNFDEAVLDGADFDYAVLDAAHFHASSLSHTRFEKSSLAGAHFEHASLGDADFFAANLVGSDLEEANVQEAKLSIANLSYATLINTDMRRARLLGTRLDKANLRGADLRDVQYLTQAQIDVALGDSSTQLPATLRRPKGWL